LRSNIKCTKDEFIGFIKHLLPAESKRELAIGDLFWVFGTQDKAFTEVDRKLDRDHFLQDRAASTGVFNKTLASTKGRSRKNKGFFNNDLDSDSEDEDAEAKLRNQVNSIQISLPVVDTEFDKYN
jgi:hypothetical protein